MIKIFFFLQAFRAFRVGKQENRLNSGKDNVSGRKQKWHFWMHSGEHENRPKNDIWKRCQTNKDTQKQKLNK